ncbi:MAG: response regulator [Candidatus Saccharibacteria bacterium]
MSSFTVLVVEDDVWLSEQYARILKKSNYNVLFASNALTAIQIIDDNKLDVIILDVLLTGSTAFALLHELQSYGDIGEIPIIMCTNLSSDLSIENLSPYGVKCIIDKTTMKPSDILVEIKNILL